MCSGQRVIVQEKCEDKLVDNVVTIQVIIEEMDYANFHVNNCIRKLIP